MRQRGRKSASAQNVVNLAVVDVSQEKPEPLEHLTSEQQQVWRDVVAAMKPGSFNAATFPLLASYCSHVTMARFLGGELHKCNTELIQKSSKPCCRCTIAKVQRSRCWQRSCDFCLEQIRA